MAERNTMTNPFDEPPIGRAELPRNPNIRAAPQRRPTGFMTPIHI